MSYDVYLRLTATDGCPHCGRGADREHDVFSFNLTHNVNKIVDLCLSHVANSDQRAFSWSRLEGMQARDAIGVLRLAVATANSPTREADFRALEPANGWGTLETVRDSLLKLLKACNDFPAAIIYTSG